MTTKSKVAPATPKARTRRKAKSTKVVPNVVANIVFINPYTRKLQAHSDWLSAFRMYANTLSNDEQTLVRKCIAFTIAKPENREYLHGPCPVIPFPVRNHQSKSSLEA